MFVGNFLRLNLLARLERLSYDASKVRLIMQISAQRRLRHKSRITLCTSASVLRLRLDLERVPNYIQRVAPQNIFFTYCRVSTSAKLASALILVIKGLFVNRFHEEGQPKVQVLLNRVLQTPQNVAALKSTTQLPSQPSVSRYSVVGQQLRGHSYQGKRI